MLNSQKEPHAGFAEGGGDVMEAKRGKTEQILLAVYLIVFTAYLMMSRFSSAMTAGRSDAEHWEEAFSNREFFRGGSDLYYMGLLVLLAFAWTIAAGACFERNWKFHIPKKPSKWVLVTLLVSAIGFALCAGYSSQGLLTLVWALWAILFGITAAILFFGYGKTDRGHDKKTEPVRFLSLRIEKIVEAVLWECGAFTCREFNLLLLPSSYAWPIVRIAEMICFLLGAAWMLNEIIVSVKKQRASVNDR